MQKHLLEMPCSSVLEVASRNHTLQTYSYQNPQEFSDIKEDEESESRSFLSAEKPGWIGSGISHLLLNIRDTTAMLGLSSGYGCTHNNAI